MINDVYQQFVAACKEHLPKDEAVCTWKTFLKIDGCEGEAIWNGCPDSGSGTVLPRIKFNQLCLIFLNHKFRTNQELCEDPDAPVAEEPDSTDDSNDVDQCAEQALLQAECLDSMVVKLTRE